MHGHQSLIFDRLRGDQPLLHVIVQMCSWMDHWDNPIVIARSWADAEADWSFIRGLIVEIITDSEVEAELCCVIAKQIQASGAKQVFITFEDNGRSFAVFWKDSGKEKIEILPIWT